MDGGRIEGWRRGHPELSTCMQSTELMTARTDASTAREHPRSTLAPTDEVSKDNIPKPQEDMAVPWWLALLGARRSAVWGTEPGDLRAMFTGRTGDLRQERALEHVHSTPELRHSHRGAHEEDSAEALWNELSKDAAGGVVLDRESFLHLHQRVEAATRAHDEHHGRPWLVLYQTPQQRHKWGEHQPAFHPWMGDIMLDLIVVGVCYMLGDVIKLSFYKCTAYDTYSNASSYVEYDELASGGPGYPYDGGDDDEAAPYCVGLSEGVLHAAAFYLCIFRLWSCGMMYRARFCTDGSVAHLTLDVASGLLVVLASHGVRPPVDYLLETPPRHAATGFVLLLIFALPALGLFMLRYLELALLHPTEASRRTAGAQLVHLAGSAVWWGAALAAAAASSRHAAHSRVARDLLRLCAALTLVGGWWYDARISYVLLRERSLRRRGYTRGALGRKTKTVPMNLNFVLHRWQEFMYLMLGEAILQLVISAATTVRDDGSGDVEDDNLYYAVVISGFLAVLCMGHSYHLTEPHRADHHATRRSAVSGILFAMLFSFRGFSVLCVGVGFKLALYDPHGTRLEDATTANQPGQRTALAAPMAVCFGLQMLMHPLHIGFKRYYSPRWLRRHPGRTVCIVLRLVLIAAMGASAATGLEPWQLAILQAMLAVAQAALLQAQLVWFGTQREQHHAGMQRGSSGHLHLGGIDADAHGHHQQQQHAAGGSPRFGGSPRSPRLALPYVVEGAAEDGVEDRAESDDESDDEPSVGSHGPTGRRANGKPTLAHPRSAAPDGADAALSSWPSATRPERGLSDPLAAAITPRSPGIGAGHEDEGLRGASEDEAARSSEQRGVSLGDAERSSVGSRPEI